MKNISFYLVMAFLFIILTGCPESTEDPAEPNQPEEMMPSSQNDAGGSEGPVNGSVIDAGNTDASADGSDLDSGSTDGTVDGSSLDSGNSDGVARDAGSSDGTTDGSAMDAGSSDGATDGSAIDAGSSDGATDGQLLDAGSEQAFSCANLDSVVWRFGGTSGPCGPQNSVTFHANGQVVESLQGFSPEGPNNTCVANERHFEVLASRTQALIQSVCEDYLANHEAVFGCVGAYSRWVFMDGGEEVEQTDNLSCGNTSMSASAAVYEAFMDSLMAPNTCEYGCSSNDECDEGYRCQGAVSSGSEGMGQCIENGVLITGEGATCDSSDGACSDDLVCTGDLMGEGWNAPTCEPAWTANRFASNPVVAIPDSSFIINSQTICGLYTVPMGGILYLDITHDNISQLQVSLDNPDGGYAYSFTLTETILNEGLIVRPPTDESANGTWTLRVEDTVSGGIGTLNGWALYLESWPD